MKLTARLIALTFSGLALAACSDNGPVQPGITPNPSGETRGSAAFQCTASTGSLTISCAPAELSAAKTGDVKAAVILGGQNLNVRVLTGGPPAYLDSIGEFRFNLALVNLMAQAMGTANGVTKSPAGIKVFLLSGPTLTSGSGSTGVISDGTATFTAPGQHYYEFNGNVGVDSLLSTGEHSSPRIFRFLLPPNVTFVFTILISTDVQFPATGQGGSFFQRYVALGGANAAGFRNAGLVDSLQDDSYAAQLAVRAGAVFRIPLVQKPGCPAPVSQFGSPPNAFVLPCKIDVGEPPTMVGQNSAVPGEKIRDMLVRPTTPPVSIWNTLLLHGTYTQLQRALIASPTFVTIGAGDEDVLAAALAGRLGTANGLDSISAVDSILTRAALFDSRYNDFVNQLVSGSPALMGGALIGVMDPIMFDPILQPGAYFFLSRDATGRFNGMPVNNNCSPVTALGTPNPLSTNHVSFALFADPDITEINCDPASPQGGDYLLDSNEKSIMQARVTSFNNTIQTIATNRGWVFVNPNTVFASALTTVDGSGNYQEIRKCQLLASATTAAQFQNAVLRSCPVTISPFAAPNIGGRVFSLDGTTLSKEGQRTLTLALVNAINTRYGTSIINTP